MLDQSRRKVLKSIGYGIALSISTGASTTLLALAKEKAENKMPLSALPSCDITIYRQKTSAKEIVTLMNLTDKPITLDSIKPVGLEHINSSLVVNINNIADGATTLSPGERLSFEIEATSNHPMQEGVFIPNVLAGHVSISSDHPDFNGVIPVTVFDGQTA